MKINLCLLPSKLHGYIIYKKRPDGFKYVWTALKRAAGFKSVPNIYIHVHVHVHCIKVLCVHDEQVYLVCTGRCGETVSLGAGEVSDVRQTRGNAASVSPNLREDQEDGCHQLQGHVGSGGNINEATSTATLLCCIIDMNTCTCTCTYHVHVHAIVAQVYYLYNVCTCIHVHVRHIVCTHVHACMYSTCT